jgi:hypothetical protein
MAYSVIIAERNEPDLAATVANIKANSNASVIVMSDKNGAGPQMMRHHGITKATADVVIVMDGHMRIRPGALDELAQWCMDNPKSVAVAQCYHHHNETWTGQPYGAARFAWMDAGKDAHEAQAFVAKWRKDTCVGQVPCVMGACYAFRRDWYMDGLRKPWAFGTGWGCDEEIISAATWLRGGTVDLLPVQVWHRARDPKEVPYKLTPRQYLGVWANRTRLLDMLPMTESDRIELIRHIMPGLSMKQWREVEKINGVFADEVADYRHFLSTGPMKWATFKEMVGMETVKPMKMKDLREVAKKRGITVPRGATIAKLTTLLQGGDGMEKVPKSHKKPAKKAQSRANWGPNEINNAGRRCCVDCGGTNTTVYRTIPGVGGLSATMRYRECTDCGKKFPTRDKADKK